MKFRTGKEIRRLFIDFWGKEKGSHHYPSFSLIPNDPTLMFTIAGMVPFKSYYLGIRQPEHPSAVTCQKCVRTNDIENVGHTARHHTFFEMLGNFSWGGYFKKEAISGAWEFLTERIGLDPDRLYATVHEDDDEAAEAWRSVLPDARLRRFGESENYWFMGETGPCGPCSEIYYDRGEKYSCGSPTCGVGCSCDRYMEIWNLVFTQFDRQKDGSLTPLSRKNIDTGMGLERLASIVQGVDTDYETDLFLPLIEHTNSLGRSADPLAARIIADHVRSVAFMLADGVLPSNDGPGYVLRRLLRRAVRYGRLLGIGERGFLTSYIPILIDIMGDPYRELIDSRASIERIIEVEEERFGRTLNSGMEMFASAAKEGGVISGDVAFALYDTYGFPLELTLDMAEERGISVDRAGFEAAMTEQRERARAGSKHKKSALGGDVYTELESSISPTAFTGYDKTDGEARVVAIVRGRESVDSTAFPLVSEGVEVVLDVTPFYAERGGQVGDSGRIICGGVPFPITDVVPRGKLTFHRVRAGDMAPDCRLSVGDVVMAEVDADRRLAIRRNHTATHLLHEALIRALGSHVRQAGSLITDDALRFDYTHHEAMTPGQMREVEDVVNRAITDDLPVETAELSRDEARELGAKALFDEKYGERVRVVSVGGISETGAFSRELCGGLHVARTGEIGLFKIAREEGVGSGTRRILAHTGLSAVRRFQRLTELVGRLGALLSTDEAQLPEKTEALLEELKLARRRVEEAEQRDLAHSVEFALSNVGPVVLQTGRFANAKPDALRGIGDKAKGQHSPTVVVMASVSGDSCSLTVMADDAAVSIGADAGRLVKAAAAVLGGRGGGRPNMAQGGGKPDRLDEAIAGIGAALAEQIG
ncbi:MAG: alanine--tRNA ligase [Synergistaceae bacterium]|nr:alanine--tRNA ligase [Synergistaceae bacterium]